MSLKTVLLPLTCGFMLTPLSVVANAPEPQTSQRSVVTYRCGGGGSVQMAYLNFDKGDSYATLYYKGELIQMHASRSGSGALYVADNEQNSYRWHVKDDSGMLSFLEADHTAVEKQLLTDCSAIKSEP